MNSQKHFFSIHWACVPACNQHIFTFFIVVFVGFLSQTYLNLERRCPTNYVNSFLSRLASNAIVSHSCCKSHYGALPCKSEIFYRGIPFGLHTQQTAHMLQI